MREPVSPRERVAPTQQAPPLVERRTSERTLLRGVVGTMNWRAEAGEVSCEVVVLNISGGGAALKADDAPTAGHALRLGLRCGSAAMDPIEGQVVETRTLPAGGLVVHVRFARWVPLDSLLEKHRERRLWERYPVREARGSLAWQEGEGEKSIPGDLMNISGGGAAFASEGLPPPGVPLWLRLDAGARQAPRVEAVECRLLMTSADPSGMRIAHVQFVDPCPMDLFELAVEGRG